MARVLTLSRVHGKYTRIPPGRFFRKTTETRVLSAVFSQPSHITFCVNTTRTPRDKRATGCSTSVLFATTQVLQFARRAERQAIAWGWARFTSATMVSTASAALAKDARKLAALEARVVDLQQKVR